MNRRLETNLAGSAGDAQIASLPRAPELLTGYLTGGLVPFRSNPLRLFERAVERFGDTSRIRFLRTYFNVVRHPDDVKRVLVDNSRNYGKRTVGYDKLRVFLGNGMLTSEGEFWRRQRRIAQPAFHRDRIGAFADTMVRMAGEMLDGWEAPAREGRGIDVDREMMAITLRIVASTLLSIDVSDKEREVGDAVSLLIEFANDAITRILPIHEKLPTRKHQEFTAAAGALDEMVYGMIAERRRDPGDRGDLLSMFMNTVDEETGESMTDQQLRDEIMTMFLAGHETTANGLSWALYCLARDPDVRARLAAEVREVLAGRAPTLEDVPRLIYTRMIIDESLRLYPPVWLAGRNVVEDDVLGGYRVPRGELVFVSPYLTHRHPEFWPEPETFDPERFRPERVKARPRYAYFPFSGGPRKCIGDSFALMEMTLVLACIAQRFELELVPGHPVELEPLVTMRPRFGIRAVPHRVETC